MEWVSMEINFTEFRANAKRCFDAVDDGESVQISRGKRMYRLESVQIVEDKVKVVRALISEYGCSCSKEEGKALCGKHGRY
jgi:hypothetical protein